MPNETRATRYHRSRLQAGAAAFLVSLLVLVACGPVGAGPALAGALAAVLGDSPVAQWAATAAFAAIVLAAVHAASYPFDRHREWTLEGRYGLARLSAGRWLRTHVRGIAARITAGDDRGARGGGDVALVRQRLVDRDGRRLLSGPSDVDRHGAAAARRVRRLAAAAPRRAGGAARRAGPALGRRRRGARMARRRRDGAGARGPRRPRPDPPDPALGHARRYAARRRDRGRGGARDRAPRPRRRLARGGVAPRSRCR